MDSYSLADIAIKCILIIVGLYLIIRGKNAKSNVGNQQELIPPNALMVLGVVIIVTNAYFIIAAVL